MVTISASGTSSKAQLPEGCSLLGPLSCRLGLPVKFQLAGQAHALPQAAHQLWVSSTLSGLVEAFAGLPAATERVVLKNVGNALTVLHWGAEHSPIVYCSHPHSQET